MTDKTADIAWKIPEEDGGTPITGYTILLRENRRSTWSTAGEVKDDQRSFTLTGLVAGSDYYVQIIAVNAEGQSEPLYSKEPIRPEKILREFDVR